jgi:hypothetical protein
MTDPLVPITALASRLMLSTPQYPPTSTKIPNTKMNTPIVHTI